VGDEAVEVIQGFAVARALDTTEADFMSTVFPHPTRSGAMH
jgi:dihydrolipoamide dehydrogenase